MKHYKSHPALTFRSTKFWKQSKVGIYWSVFVLVLPFDLIKAGATKTETSFKQHDAGKRVYLPDDYDVPGRTITETKNLFTICVHIHVCLLLNYNMQCRTVYCCMSLAMQRGQQRSRKRSSKIAQKPQHLFSTIL